MKQKTTSIYHHRSNQGSLTSTSLTALLTTLAFTVTGSAIAQDVGEDSAEASLEEVIVTARKREESIYDVPISISVGMAASASLSQILLRIGRPETACKLVSVTNSLAEGVNTTCTSAPRSRRRRTSSGVL